MEKVSFAKSYIEIFFKDFTANNIFVYMLSCDKIILIAKEKKRRQTYNKGRKQINKQETKIISVLDKISDDSRTFQ